MMIIIIISRTCVTKRITFLPVQALDTTLPFCSPVVKGDTHTKGNKKTRKKEEEKASSCLLHSGSFALAYCRGPSFFSSVMTRDCFPDAF
jgi:hypothetical protein